ncbi:Uncharacterised protein [Mycobacterium tuberculosis]|nr:Uncharacterised protein [Mycobacterium tuberculosis]
MFAGTVPMGHLANASEEKERVEPPTSRCDGELAPGHAPLMDISGA